jgi:hypothetical protein
MRVLGLWEATVPRRAVDHLMGLLGHGRKTERTSRHPSCNRGATALIEAMGLSTRPACASGRLGLDLDCTKAGQLFAVPRFFNQRLLRSNR